MISFSHLFNYKITLNRRSLKKIFELMTDMKTAGKCKKLVIVIISVEIEIK